jgi:hypothetical protein
MVNPPKAMACPAILVEAPLVLLNHAVPGHLPQCLMSPSLVPPVLLLPTALLVEPLDPKGDLLSPALLLLVPGPPRLSNLGTS